VRNALWPGGLVDLLHLVDFVDRFGHEDPAAMPALHLLASGGVLEPERMRAHGAVKTHSGFNLLTARTSAPIHHAEGRVER
jgi:hypothetical protein